MNKLSYVLSKTQLALRNQIPLQFLSADEIFKFLWGTSVEIKGKQIGSVREQLKNYLTPVYAQKNEFVKLQNASKNEKSPKQVSKKGRKRKQTTKTDEKVNEKEWRSCGDEALDEIMQILSLENVSEEFLSQKEAVLKRLLIERDMTLLKLVNEMPLNGDENHSLSTICKMLPVVENTSIIQMNLVRKALLIVAQFMYLIPSGKRTFRISAAADLMILYASTRKSLFIINIIYNDLYIYNDLNYLYFTMKLTHIYIINIIYNDL